MRKALVVGINDYPKCELKGCLNDAIAMGNVLDNNGDGSPNFAVEKMLDVKNKGELLEGITKLFDGDCETALFYFSGHGFINELGGYIVTPDYSKFDMGVSMDDILRLANSSKIKNKIIILDCCHSGAIASVIPNNNTVCNISEGVSILTASRDYEVAMEKDEQGVFTTLLIEALKGGAANVNGKITPGSVYAYIDQALGPWEQRPVFKTNVTEFNVIREVEPQVPISVIRNLTKYFKSPQDEFKLDPSFEYTNMLEVEHKVIEPYADEKNVLIFKELQKLESVGLIVPVDEEHMYFAAMNSKSCKLTALGYHYWKLVNKKKI